MSLGLVGKKIGMSRVFTEEGRSTPVTVIEVLPNKITQVRTEQTDGYNGLQVTTGQRRASRVNSAMKGHFAKAGVEPGRGVWEFRLDDAADTQLGTELTVDLFSEGQKVDISGQTIGKGFAGVMKRHGFKGGRATHGNSKAHRLGGSIGNAQDPGRVFKGKKMAGHMGANNAVQQNLDVVRVDSERNIILISGSIPGSKGANVIIRPAVKSNEYLEIPTGQPEPAAVEEIQEAADTQESTPEETGDNQES
jgi:large subunit ribosomal protein L3